MRCIRHLPKNKDLTTQKIKSASYPESCKSWFS